MLRVCYLRGSWLQIDPVREAAFADNAKMHDSILLIEFPTIPADLWWSTSSSIQPGQVVELYGMFCKLNENVGCQIK